MINSNCWKKREMKQYFIIIFIKILCKKENERKISAIIRCYNSKQSKFIQKNERGKKPDKKTIKNEK